MRLRGVAPELRRLSVQETYEPAGRSFGSGQHNAYGLKLRSYRLQAPLVERDEDAGGRGAGAAQISGLETPVTFSSHHNGFPGLACGGIVGAAMETVGNWNAAIKIMDDDGMDVVPLTVTGNYSIRINKPTPCGAPMVLLSRAVRRKDTVVKVEIILVDDDERTARAISSLGGVVGLFEDGGGDRYATGLGTFHWIYPRERWSACG